MVFAASVTSSPNASPGFGCGAACDGGGGGGVWAKHGPASRSRLSSAARRGNRIEASLDRVARPTNDSYHANGEFACLNLHPPMRGGWRCAKLSPYNLRFRTHPMSALSGHAFVKMNGLGNEIV